MNMNDRIFRERSPGLFYKLYYLSTNWLRDWAAKKDINDDASKRTLILIILIILFGFLILITDVRAACVPFTCIQAGGKCIDNECVMPTPTPTPATTPTKSCNAFICATSGGSCIDGVCVPITPSTPPVTPPPPTQIPVPAGSVLLTVQRLYCDTRICVIIVSPPEYLNQLTSTTK